VASCANGKDSWYKTVFLSIGSRLLSSEERSLLWQTMHSDGRFGYRVRSEQRRPANPGESDCPFCGPERANPATDPGETMEHAYGTCPGLLELWVWAAQMFLVPARGKYAAKSWSTAIRDQDKAVALSSLVSARTSSRDSLGSSRFGAGCTCAALVALRFSLYLISLFYAVGNALVLRQYFDVSEKQFPVARRGCAGSLAGCGSWRMRAGLWPSVTGPSQ
jgi:hypothetical protein